MGYGSYSEERYRSDTLTRSVAGVKDFAFTEQAEVTKQTHTSLDPARIKGKPLGKLEARDSEEHPLSFPVIVTIDVTGSNKNRAKAAQAKLNLMMSTVTKYIANPQIAIWANDDFEAVGTAGALQISDFESDNRIDEAIRNLWLVGRGGGNSQESYDLLLYTAARKTVTDHFEKRGQRGMMFMFMDEPLPLHVNAQAIERIFGDSIQEISIQDIITEAQQYWDIYALAPSGGCIHNSYQQYVRLFGADRVIDLQHPDVICEMVACTIGMHEAKASEEQILQDLVAGGVSKDNATIAVQTVTKTSGRTGTAARL